jgi:hypothetical protein
MTFVIIQADRDCCVAGACGPVLGGMAETEGSGFKSRTNSSKGVYKRNGETMAICHKTIPKSYGGPTNSKANTR